MNKWIGMGRLTKAPEIRYTNNSKVVTQFDIAVNRDFKNANGEYEADFFHVVMWGKVAELAGNILDKGHRVLLEGRLQNRSYEAKDGTKRYVTEIIADKMEFIERKADIQKHEEPKTMAEMGQDVTSPADFENVPF
jgi:single-strand DNA-binding protein